MSELTRRKYRSICTHLQLRHRGIDNRRGNGRHDQRDELLFGIIAVARILDLIGWDPGSSRLGAEILETQGLQRSRVWFRCGNQREQSGLRVIRIARLLDGVRGNARRGRLRTQLPYVGFCSCRGSCRGGDPATSIRLVPM
jgi:hypothetical protein